MSTTEIQVNVLLIDNLHFRDYWSRQRTQTWLLVEDNGTEDGGAIIAEFRECEHATAFCSAMKWSFTE